MNQIEYKSDFKKALVAFAEKLRTYVATETGIEKAKETDKKTEKTDKKAKETDKKTSDKILDFIKNNHNITIKELASIIKISNSAVNQQIIKMRKQGILRRDGADKGGMWMIIDKENQNKQLNLKKLK